MTRWLVLAAVSSLVFCGGCASLPSTIREYTPVAGKLVRDECVVIRTRIKSLFEDGQTDAATALARMRKTNAMCDGAADAVVFVDDFAAFAEEARSWGSDK